MGANFVFIRRISLVKVTNSRLGTIYKLMI